MKRYLRNSVVAALALAATGSFNVQGAFDEHLQMYVVDGVVVTAERTKNQFGDTLTEQSYYRTGGDVKVITREEIEKRHYTDLTEAIRRVPGVTFTNAGYRGGEYGYNAYNNSMAINGDTHVVVLVDGRRIDNEASTRFGRSNAKGTRTAVDLNQAVSIESVEKIEVIKGPGASIYGSDATGGVINIITRKGASQPSGTIDVATGSWNKHVYNVSLSGGVGDDQSLRYFLTASRQMASDSEYYDNMTGMTHTYNGTSYKDEGVTARIDKDISDHENLRIWYNHQSGKDGYPITARDWRYWSDADWERILIRTQSPGGYGNTDNPGYRNLFSLDALSGSYNAYRNNDLSIRYMFNKDNKVESFIRLYKQSHKYWGVDRYPEWYDENDKTNKSKYVIWPGSPKWDAFIAKWKEDHPIFITNFFYEDNRGVQLQYGKSIGKHDILGSIIVDKAKLTKKHWDRTDQRWTDTTVKRDSIRGFVQDKIHVNDHWDITPALRYSHYNTFSTVSEAGVTNQDNSGSTNITPAFNTEYSFDDSLSAYFGWTKIHRPIKAADYSAATLNGVPLEDEKGSVWTIGLRKSIGYSTDFYINYSLTNMDNAVTGYSVFSTEKNKYVPKEVNAKQVKKSFNMTVDHYINDNWNISLAYTRLHDKYTAKEGMQFDPEIGLGTTSNVNFMINELRPANHYILNVSYQNGPWHTGILMNWYTGMNTIAFTTDRALVIDWNLNYEVNDALSTYMTISNLTNEGYENAYSAYNGVGAAPQPGRAYMIGAKYKF